MFHRILPYNYYQLITLRFLSTDHNISIGLFDHMGKGSHELFAGNFSPQGWYEANAISFSPPTGNVSITLHNMVARKMEGSFNFSAEPEGGGPVVNMEGSFAFNY